VDEQELFEQVKGAIISTLKPGDREIKYESRLTEDLGGDSLDMLELIMALEERFGLEVPDEDAEYIKTVRDITEYVKKRLAENA
jgi:acyl carrier protein